LLDYLNQPIHGLLDRSLGQAVLAYLLEGTCPELSRTRSDEVAAYLRPYVPDRWHDLGAATIGGIRFPLTLRNAVGERLGVLPRQALQSVPDAGRQRDLLAGGATAQGTPGTEGAVSSTEGAVSSTEGVVLCSQTDFDLTRRPHWVINQIASMSSPP
jgi:hypothetical protein